MNREAWQYITHEARTDNDALFNKAITSNFEEYFYTTIQKIVQDEALTRDISNTTMLKFWERFILMGEDLPESNIDGYVYQMIRNAFYELRRQKDGQRNLNTVSMESQDIIEKYKDMDDDAQLYNARSTNQENKMHRVLFATVQRQFIQKNIIDGQSLVKIKEELEMYGSYNAIVQ